MKVPESQATGGPFSSWVTIDAHPTRLASVVTKSGLVLSIGPRGVAAIRAAFAAANAAVRFSSLFLMAAASFSLCGLVNIASSASSFSEMPSTAAIGRTMSEKRGMWFQ